MYHTSQPHTHLHISANTHTHIHTHTHTHTHTHSHTHGSDTDLMSALLLFPIRILFSIFVFSSCSTFTSRINNPLFLCFAVSSKLLIEPLQTSHLIHCQSKVQTNIDITVQTKFERLSEILVQIYSSGRATHCEGM